MFAFYEADITSITLPEGLKYIEGQAFQKSTLPSIHIPSTLEELGSYSPHTGPYFISGILPVFDSKEFKSITFAENSQLYAIGCAALQNTGITSITLPDSLQVIDSYAFSNCTELESIDLPDSVEIWLKAFEGCRSLTRLEISANVDLHTEQGSNPQKFFGGLIGWLDNGYGELIIEEGSRYALVDGLFYDQADLLGPVDSDITSAVIKDGTTLIAPQAFLNCTQLQSVELPESLETIESKVFQGCTALSSIDLKHVTNIGTYAFAQSGLTSLEIPEGVTDIPLRAFYQCPELTTIVIPETVTNIGSSAFAQGSGNEYPNLTVIMKGDIPPETSTSAFQYREAENMKFIVPSGAEETYKNSSLGEYLPESEETGYTFSLKVNDSITIKERESTELTVTADIPAGAVLEADTGDETIVNTAVSDTGKVTVTGLREGSAQITVTLVLKGVTLASDTCQINVEHTHNPVKIRSQAPTCTEAGNIEYWICENCGKYFSNADCTQEISQADTVLAAYGHKFENGVCTVCGVEDPDYEAPASPVIIKGANGIWQKGDERGLSFTSNAEFKDFLSVRVDGKDLEGFNFEAKEGSTIVTLKASYLETLAAGKHTLSIVSNTGTANTEFTIKAAAASDDIQPPQTGDNTQLPQTGDSSNMAIWIALLLISGGMLSAVTYRKKKRLN